MTKNCVLSAQVYTGRYRRQENVERVESYTDLAVGSMVAVHLENYNKTPCLGKVVHQDEDTFEMEWWQGKYKSKWVKWPNCPSERLPFTCIILFNFELDGEGMLNVETARALKREYKARRPQQQWRKK